MTLKRLLIVLAVLLAGIAGAALAVMLWPEPVARALLARAAGAYGFEAEIGDIALSPPGVTGIAGISVREVRLSAPGGEVTASRIDIAIDAGLLDRTVAAVRVGTLRVAGVRDGTAFRVGPIPLAAGGAGGPGTGWRVRALTVDRIEAAFDGTGEATTLTGRAEMNENRIGFDVAAAAPDGELELAGTVPLRGGPLDIAAAARIGSARVTADIGGTVEGSKAAVDFSLTGAEVRLADTEMSALEAAGRARMDWSGDEIALALIECAAATVSGAAYGYRATGAQMRLCPRATPLATFDPGTGEAVLSASAQADDIAVAGPAADLRFRNLKLDADAARIAGGLTARGTIANGTLDIATPEFSLDLRDTDFVADNTSAVATFRDLDISDRQGRFAPLAATGTAAADGTVEGTVSASGAPDFVTFAGTFRPLDIKVTMPALDAATLRQLSPLVPATLTGGTVALDAALRARGGKPVVPGTITIDGAKLEPGPVALADIAAVLRFDDLIARKTAGPQTIAFRPVGAAFHDTGSATFALDGATLRLDEAKVRLVGGTLTAGPATVSLANGDADIPIRMGQGSLSRIAQLLPLQELEMEGAVGGTALVKLRGWTYGLEDADFVSPGGAIRYRGASAPAGGGMDVLLQAVQDFRFSEMTTTGGGTLDALAATIRLDGMNPDLYDGHPIRLNVNVEFPLAALLAAGANVEAGAIIRRVKEDQLP